MLYKANNVSVNILEKLPSYYLPYYNSPTAKGVDFNIYGSDNTITKGELIGNSIIGETGRVVHSGVLTAGVLYTAKIQMRGAFQ